MRVCLRGGGCFLPGDMLLTLLLQLIKTHPLLLGTCPQILLLWFSLGFKGADCRAERAAAGGGSPRSWGGGDRGGVAGDSAGGFRGCLVSGGQKSTCSSNCISSDPPATHPSLLRRGQGCRVFILTRRQFCSSIPRPGVADHPEAFLPNRTDLRRLYLLESHERTMWFLARLSPHHLLGSVGVGRGVPRAWGPLSSPPGAQSPPPTPRCGRCFASVTSLCPPPCPPSLCGC